MLNPYNMYSALVRPNDGNNKVTQVDECGNVIFVEIRSSDTSIP